MYYCPLKPLVSWPRQRTIFTAVSHSCEIYKLCGSSQTPSTMPDSTAGLGYITNSWMCGWVMQSSSAEFILLLYSCHDYVFLFFLFAWVVMTTRLKVFQQTPEEIYWWYEYVLWLLHICMTWFNHHSCQTPVPPPFFTLSCSFLFNFLCLSISDCLSLCCAQPCDR